MSLLAEKRHPSGVSSRNHADGGQRSSASDRRSDDAVAFSGRASRVASRVIFRTKPAFSSKPALLRSSIATALSPRTNEKLQRCQFFACRRIAVIVRATPTPQSL